MNRDLNFLDDKKNFYTGGVLYEDNDHKYIWLGAEEIEKEDSVHVNQYLIIHKGKGILLDAGGISAFPQVLANLSRFIDTDSLDILFYSHQDPDVCSGIALWMDISNAKSYIGDYWTQFVPHLGIKDLSNVTPIPDDGLRLPLGGDDFLEFIPAHYLHSVSNFTLYDSRSKILFSGDIGAALFPKGERYIIVKDFNSHLSLMEGFHKRFMASNKACKLWTDKINQYEISAIVPQHGAIFTGDNIKKFINWFSTLECGVDLI